MPTDISDPLGLAIDEHPPVTLDDGSVATVRSIGVGDDRGEWVIPTIVGGRPVSNDEAIQLWRAGKNKAIGGPFKTVEEGNAFGQKFHESEAKRLGLTETADPLGIDTQADADPLGLNVRMFRGRPVPDTSKGPLGGELPSTAPIFQNLERPAVAAEPVITPEDQARRAQMLTTTGGAGTPVNAYDQPPAERQEAFKTGMFAPSIEIPQDEATQQFIRPFMGALGALAMTTKSGKGISTGVQHLAEGFTSPVGIATLAMGALPRGLQRLVSLGFALQMAEQVPEVAAQLGDQFGKPEAERDPALIAQLITEGAGTVGMTAAAGTHAAIPGDGGVVKSAVVDMRQRPGGELPPGAMPPVPPPAEPPAAPATVATPGLASVSDAFQKALDAVSKRSGVPTDELVETIKQAVSPAGNVAPEAPKASVPSPPAVESKIEPKAEPSQAPTGETPGREVPDYDPEDVGKKVIIQRKVGSGKTRDEAVAESSAETENTRRWVEENTASGDVVQAKDGRLYYRNGNEWSLLNQTGTDAGALADLSSLRGGKIIRKGLSYRDANALKSKFVRSENQGVERFDFKDDEPAPRDPLSISSATSEAAKMDIPEQVAKEIGFTFRPAKQIGAMSIEGLTPKDISDLKAAGHVPLWEFTDENKPPGHPEEGLTFYVPEGSSREEILKAFEAKKADTAKRIEQARIDNGRGAKPGPPAAGAAVPARGVDVLQRESSIHGSQYRYLVVDEMPWQVRVADHYNPSQTSGGNAHRGKKLLKEATGRDYPHEINWIIGNPEMVTDDQIVKVIRALVPKIEEADGDLFSIGGAPDSPYLNEWNGQKFIETQINITPESEASRTIPDSPKSADNQIQTEYQMVEGNATEPTKSEAVKAISNPPSATPTADPLEIEKSHATAPAEPKGDTPILTNAVRRQNQIYLSFDITGKVPTKTELNAMFKDRGHDVEFVQFEPNVMSTSEGVVKFRGDAVNATGQYSTPDAERAFKDVFGQSEDIRSKSRTSEAMPWEDRFKKTLRTYMDRESGVPRSEQPVTKAPAEVANTKPDTKVETPGPETVETPVKPAARQETTPEIARAPDYQIKHRPNSEGPRAFDLLENELAPRDIYENPQYYTGDPSSVAFRESVRALARMKGKPDAKVKVYRASPKNSLNSGDWIALSKRYAKQHGMADDPRADVPVHEFEVSAKDIRWAGDSLEEYGYFPESLKPSTPTLRPGEKGTGDTGSDAESIAAAEKTSADRRKREGEEIAARRQLALEQTGTEGEKQRADAVEQWLNKAVEATNYDPSKLLEGVASAPVWVTKALANGALRVVRAAYKGGKALAAAIEDGLQWLRSEAGKDFNESEARDWLTQAANEPEAPQADWESARDERDAATAALASAREAVQQAGGRRNANTELKNKLNEAIGSHKTAVAKLRQQPGYVEDLLSRLQASADKMEMEDLRGELTMIAPDLLDRVYQDMQARGAIPKSQKLPEPFSSLQGLTDWLRANDIDSPKRGFLERLNLYKRAADAVIDAKDRARNAWAKTVAVAKAQWELFKHPPIDDDFRALVKDWGLSDQQSGLETYRWQAELNRKVENPTRRAAIMAWIQAGGDLETLRDQHSRAPDQYKAIWKAATELTADEKAVGNQIRADWRQKLDIGQNAGLIEEGRENYGPTMWKVPPKLAEGDSTFAANGALETRKGSPGNPNAKLDPRDPFFSFHKSFPTFFDGIMAGGVPETMDVSKLVGHYNLAFNKSLSSRAVIKAMLDAKAKDGRPVVILSGRADPLGGDGVSNRGYIVDSRYKGQDAQTADGRPYLAVDHKALKDWKFLMRTEDGKPIISRADMLVHPDHVEFLKNVLGEQYKDPKTGRTYDSIIRRYAIGRGILKGNRFLKESLVAFAPFHISTLAQEGAFWRVNPLPGDFNLDLSDRVQRGLVRGGVDLGFSNERVEFQDGMSGHGGIWGLIPGAGDLSNEIGDLTFKKYLPVIKMKAAISAFEYNTKKYGGKLTEEQIFDLSASQANAAFGIQNNRLLGRSPFVRDLMSLAAFAPDFLMSRMKQVGQAFKPYGAAQRRKFVTEAAALYITCRTIQAIVDPDHDPHFGWRDAFSVIYKGRRYSIRTVLSDVWHLLTDPRSFSYGRISQPIRVGAEALTGKDWRGVNRTGAEQMQDALMSVVPMFAQGLVTGASSRDDGLVQALGRSGGMVSRKDTPAMEVRDLASDYNRKSGDPEAEAWQKARDQETLPDSAYRKLDTLLENGDITAAKKEYDRLISLGHKAATIGARFRNVRPFTGTRARDQKFYDTLSDSQKKLFDRAKAEHREQYNRFLKMFKETELPGEV